MTSETEKELLLRVADDLDDALSPPTFPRPMMALSADEARTISRVLREAEGWRQAWECTGCGRISFRPESDLNGLRAKGYLSCCPERKLIAVQVSPPPPATETTKTEEPRHD